MILNKLHLVPSHIKLGFAYKQKRSLVLNKNGLQQTAQPQAVQSKTRQVVGDSPPNDRIVGEIFPTARVVPMVVTNKEPVVLSFDDVPGPKSLKYLASARSYLSEIGTQMTAGVLTFGLNVGSYLSTKKDGNSLSVLFDQYGPVVRFVSPIGRDIVLLCHPDHIQKVYTMEGEYPVRSTLDSLEKYRTMHRNHVYRGFYTSNNFSHGVEWDRQRSIVYTSLHNSVTNQLQGLNDVCDSFTLKMYNIRNYQDEVTKDLSKEIHKWAFDCLGLILFSKRFTMLNTELVYSQCDMSWLYHSLEKATEAIIKCETGLQFWKMFTTPTWNSLVKYCDSLDNLIGKHVLEAEQAISYRTKDEILLGNSLINAMLLGEEKMSPEDISTVIMDMLLIGVNTVTSSTSFLLYHLAKHQKAQKMLYKEILENYPNSDNHDFKNIRNDLPYLQACIKETLRLVPPIPILTRILPKNITIDRYNIPRGTLIIMSTQDASLKESNYENANAFQPERWLKPDSKDYHPFASIPFGFGNRKCLAQNIAETMMSLLAVRVIQKYKLEYHYGDIAPKKSFIATPNRPLKIRFIDRL